MPVPSPRLTQLAHLFSANAAAVFWNSTSSEVDIGPDDRTLVNSTRNPSHSDEAGSILLSDVPEDAVCVNPQYVSCHLPTSSKPHDTLVRLSIIDPIPTAENLLAHESIRPFTTLDALISPPSCTPALTPPPTHYKRRRARIISSNEDRDPDPDPISTGPDIDIDCTLRFPF
ncbi:hypothetical protein F5148DRAFT_619309 [Russula earlei]|uniref:Uncharacterized protein n=1 Tax=Russula earlei TaxID=71964 RepID=A0ACC0TVS8_9AGAM|nr:hypothetical protein F5148DRAFT_619309 [Russula earlei]